MGADWEQISPANLKGKWVLLQAAAVWSPRCPPLQAHCELPLLFCFHLRGDAARTGGSPQAPSQPQQHCPFSRSQSSPWHQQLFVHLQAGTIITLPFNFYFFFKWQTQPQSRHPAAPSHRSQSPVWIEAQQTKALAICKGMKNMHFTHWKGARDLRAGTEPLFNIFFPLFPLRKKLRAVLQSALEC